MDDEFYTIETPNENYGIGFMLFTIMVIAGMALGKFVA